MLSWNAEFAMMIQRLQSKRLVTQIATRNAHDVRVSLGARSQSLERGARHMLCLLPGHLQLLLVFWGVVASPVSVNLPHPPSPHPP